MRVHLGGGLAACDLRLGFCGMHFFLSPVRCPSNVFPAVRAQREEVES